MRSNRYNRILVGVVALAFAACTDDPSAPATTFTATLTRAQEVPPITTGTGAGTATCTANGTGFSCTVNYSNLTGAPTQAHIHAGNAGATGSVRVNLCGAGTQAACPGTASGSFTSTAEAPSGVTYDAFLTTMRGFGAYVNVHTAANTGGEIRGQIFGVY